ALAVYLLFRGVMEVELHQFVTFAADGEETAGRIDDLDGVPVVDDAQGRRLVGELQRREIGVMHGPMTDVDRRLVLACRAGFEIPFQVGPVRRVGVPVVAPVLVFGSEAAAADEQQEAGKFHGSPRHQTTGSIVRRYSGGSNAPSMGRSSRAARKACRKR